MVVKAAIQALVEAEELKNKLSQEIDNVNRSLCLTQLQKTYQSVLLTDLDYALNKKVEQDLWNFGFKNKIEFLQTCAKDKKNSRRVENQILLSCVLQSATGFYISLLHQICTAFQLGIPLRYKCSYPNDYKNDFKNACVPKPSSCWYICQYCLVHLGDLARYNRQPQLADSYYRQAISISPDNGQPYNQLALLRAARGDKLGAAYYHARSLSVEGPFLPASNNLSQTLASTSELLKQSTMTHLNSQSYINSYLNFYFKLTSETNMDNMKVQISELSSNLITLVATDELKPETLNEMCCLDIALYNSNKYKEKKEFILEVIISSLTAMLLPVHTRTLSDILLYPALPAIKIIFEWINLNSDLLKSSAVVSRPQLWQSCCALSTNLQKVTQEFSGKDYSTLPLPEDEELQGFLPIKLKMLKFCNTSLHIHDNGKKVRKQRSLEENSCTELRTQCYNDNNCDSNKQEPNQTTEKKLEKCKNNPEFIYKLRAFRIVELIKELFYHSKTLDLNCFINEMYNTEEGIFKFDLSQELNECSQDMKKQIEELSLLREKHLIEAINLKLKQSAEHEENLDVSDDENKYGNSPKCKNLPTSISPVEILHLPPPIIISESDFREKVKEKRVGILKPQGSLEKAREEKALSRANAIEISSPDITKLQEDNNQDLFETQDTGSSSSTVSQEGAICTDIGSLLDPPIFNEIVFRKKVRTNVAMQAIMKKQESQEIKQVKFITPATTPDSISENNIAIEALNPEKKKILQPKVMKSINILAPGKKTGGILSLKDKSAGYPHLVNVDPSILEAKINADDTIVEDVKTNLISDQMNAQNVSNFIPNETEAAMRSLNIHTNNYVPWSDGKPTNVPINLEANQTNFCLNTNMDCYSYFPQKQVNVNKISFPDVVNPKEIDVRAVTMQKSKGLPQYPSNAYMKYDNNPRMRYDNTNPQNCWQYTEQSSASLLADSNKINPEFATKYPDSGHNFGSIGCESNYNPNSYERFPENTNNPYQPTHNIWWNPESAKIDNNYIAMNAFPNFPSNVHKNYQQELFNNMQQRTEKLVYNNPNFASDFKNLNFPPPPLPYNLQQPNQSQIPPGNTNLDVTSSPFAKNPEIKMPLNPLHRFNTDVPPEFVRNPRAELNAPVHSQMESSEMNTYSLFNGPQSSWQNKNVSSPQQSQWPTEGQSPLEKLLEQQKQFKFTPENKKN